MTEIKPFIRCTDYWKDRIPPEKLAAYKQLIAEKQIVKHHVIYSRKTGATVVEYSSTVPHEWILEELKKRSIGEMMDRRRKHGDDRICGHDGEQVRDHKASAAGAGRGISAGGETGHP